MLTAIAGGQPDCIPIALAFFPTTLPQLPDHNPDEHFGTDIRYVGFSRQEQEEGFLRYLKSLPKHVFVGSLDTLRTYWEFGYHPETPGTEALADARSIEDLKVISLSKITDQKRIADEVQNYHTKGLAVMGKPRHLGGEIFETSYRLRGFQRLLLDMRQNQQLVNYLFDQLTSMHVDNAVTLAQAGVDILCLDDDIGTPSSMIIGPTMWRDFLKPRMKKIIDMAKEARPDLFILYHSDGYIEPIISDLIEIGVDALNPIQPDVMSPKEIKDNYGDKLALWGAVGTQTLWSWGRPGDIEKEVKLRVETLGQNGGYIICPAYDIDVPQVPLENVAAFVEAAKKFGKVDS